MMSRGRIFVGLLALVLEIAVTPAVSHSMGVALHVKKTTAAKCRKEQVRRRSQCVKTEVPLKDKAPGPKANPPEGLSATLIVHVYVTAPFKESGRYPHGYPDESYPLRIIRLSENGERLSSHETSEHTVHVAPGRYEIVAEGPTAGFLGSIIVLVRAGQELEVTVPTNTE